MLDIKAELGRIARGIAATNRQSPGFIYLVTSDPPSLRFPQPCGLQKDSQRVGTVQKLPYVDVLAAIDRRYLNTDTKQALVV